MNLYFLGMTDINFIADPDKQPTKKESDNGADQVRWTEPEQPISPKDTGLLSILKNKGLVPSSRDEALQMIKKYVQAKEVAPSSPPAGPAKKLGGRILEMKVDQQPASAPNQAGKQPESVAASAKKTGKLSGFFKRAFSKKMDVDEDNQILATNLIHGEITTVFDWHKNLPIFIFFIVLAGLLLAGAYQGLVAWETKRIAEINADNQRFNDLRNRISLEEQGVDEIMNMQKKLGAIGSLLDRHIYWSSFFAFLEKNTLADISFGGFGGDTSGLYTLGGTARDFKALADQLITFKADPMVTRAGSRGGKAQLDLNGSGSIVFDLELLVKKDLFNKSEPSQAQ